MPGRVRQRWFAFFAKQGRKFKPVPAVPLILLLCCYALLSLVAVRLPGIYHDEVILVNQSFDVLSGEWPAFGNVPHVGAVKGYLHAPFVALFPSSVLALRVMPILVAVATIAVAAMGAAKFMRSPRLAVPAAALFAFHPTVLFAVRSDDGPVSTMMFFEVCLLWCLSGAFDTPKLRWWAGAGLSAGLGVWQKAYFIWVLLALIPFVPIALKRMRLKGSAVFTCGVILGAAPAIAANVVHGFPALGLPAGSRLNFETLWEKMSVFKDVLTGNACIEWFTSERLTIPSFFPLLLGLCLICLAIPSASGARRRTAMLLLFGILITAQTIITPASGLSVRHYALVMPLLPLFAAAVFDQALGRWKQVLGAALILTMATNLSAVLHCYSALQRTGGVKVWSDAVYDLASFVQAHPGARFVAVDWGIAEPIRYLSANQAEVEQPGWVYPGSASPAAEEVRTKICSPQVFYISHVDQAVVFEQGARVLRKAALRCGMEMGAEAQFRQRNGAGVFEVVRLKERAR